MNTVGCGALDAGVLDAGALDARDGGLDGADEPDVLQEAVRRTAASRDRYPVTLNIEDSLGSGGVPVVR
jgi:hypothetical protein